MAANTETRSETGSKTSPKAGLQAGPEAPEMEDEVEASRAPLLDHLIELRKRLVIVAAALFVAFVVVFIFSRDIVEFLLQPVYAAQRRYEAEEVVSSFQIIATGPLEIFFVRLKLSLLGALAIGFPVLAWQMYRFVAPGLYKKERGALLPFLLVMPVLFMLGAALVYYVVLPLVMLFGLNQQITTEQVSVDLLLRLAEYFGLATALLLAFGAAFQLPVVLTLLGKAGIVSSRGLRKAWKYTVVLVFAVAMFVTPPDMISQTMLAIPILILYEISIICVKLIERQRAKEDAEYEAKLAREDAEYKARREAKKAEKAAAKAAQKTAGKTAGKTAEKPASPE